MPGAVGHRFMVYPRPPAAPLPVAGGSSTEMVFAEQLAGPSLPEQAGIYQQMMFVRIAAQGGDVEPSLAMIAGSGDAVTLTANPTPIHRGPGGVGFVGDVWLDGAEPHGVFRI